MRRSNCSDPGSEENVCDKKGQGTGKLSEKEGGAVEDEGTKLID